MTLLPQDEADEFSYFHSFQKKGDFYLSIFIERFANKSYQREAKAGLMIRESLHPGSRHVFLHVGGSGQIGVSSRDSTSQPTIKHQEDYPVPNESSSLFHEEFQRGELRLKKIGSTVTGFVRSATRHEWSSIPSIQVSFDSFYVGIAMTSQSSQMETLEFSRLVSIVSLI